jgi:hypothetical protein
VKLARKNIIEIKNEEKNTRKKWKQKAIHLG